MNARVLALLCGAALWAQPQKTAPQPQKVIDDYLRAAGGSKALAQIQTEKIAGSLSEEATGKAGSYSLIVKAPNRYYSEIIVEPGRDVNAYNGMSAWGEDSPGGVRTMTGDAAKQAGAIGQYWNDRFANVKKDKFILQFAGVEQVRGRNAYDIHVLLAPGVTREVFFDTEAHLILREASAAEQFDYDDYRPVNGIETPFQIELHKGAHDYKISLTRAEFNSTVDNSVFDFPKAAGVPLPDLKALFLDLSKNQKTLQETRRQYTWHVTSEEDEGDSKGQTKSKTILEYEVFPIEGGGAVRHLLAKNSVPLSGNEKKKEDQRFNKAYEERTKERAKKAAELAADPKKQAKEQEKQDAEQQAGISDFLRSKRFTNPRRERFRGEDVLAFDFGPNPDYKPKSMEDRIIENLAGVMWIDEQAHQVVRLEAHFSDVSKIAGGLVLSVDKGSSFVFEQARVNGEVWMPSYSEVHVSGRLLLIKGGENQVVRFSDYKKFNAQSKIVIEQP